MKPSERLHGPCVGVATDSFLRFDMGHGSSDQGLSYEKIAVVMNTMGVRTRTGQAKWYAKTVRNIILKEPPTLDGPVI